MARASLVLMVCFLAVGCGQRPQPQTVDLPRQVVTRYVNERVIVLVHESVQQVWPPPGMTLSGPRYKREFVMAITIERDSGDAKVTEDAAVAAAMTRNMAPGVEVERWWPEGLDSPIQPASGP